MRFFLNLWTIILESWIEVRIDTQRGSWNVCRIVNIHRKGIECNYHINKWKQITMMAKQLIPWNDYTSIDEHDVLMYTLSHYHPNDLHINKNWKKKIQGLISTHNNYHLLGTDALHLNRFLIQQDKCPVVKQSKAIMTETFNVLYLPPFHGCEPLINNTIYTIIDKIFMFL